MFKLSVISDEVSQDLEAVSEFADDFKLDGVEIRNLWGKPPQVLLEETSRMKAVLSKHGLKVSAVASPFFKADLNSDADYVTHLEILKRCVKLAKKFDTGIIRGFTFWRKGTLSENIDAIVEKFQKPLEIIEAEDIVLGIENEPSTFVGNGQELRQFLDRIASKNVMAIWDPGNDMWDPSGETPYPDGYSHVKGKVIHVHIKDGVRKGADGKHSFTPIGEGEVDFIGQLKALRADGYAGYLSLETHWRLKQQLSEEAVMRPGGKEFSSSGEESSRICMRNLQNMLRQI